MWKLRSLLCFQGAAWVSRKVLWWRVLAMLRCWRIMVPLKILDGFDAVLASLERLVAALEQISWRLASRMVLGLMEFIVRRLAEQFNLILPDA
jgi:hypothetical protein